MGECSTRTILLRGTKMCAVGQDSPDRGKSAASQKSSKVSAACRLPVLYDSLIHVYTSLHSQSGAARTIVVDVLAGVAPYSHPRSAAHCGFATVCDVYVLGRVCDASQIRRMQAARRCHEIDHPPMPDHPPFANCAK